MRSLSCSLIQSGDVSDHGFSLWLCSKLNTYPQTDETRRLDLCLGLHTSIIALYRELVFPWLIWPVNMYRVNVYCVPHTVLGRHRGTHRRRQRLDWTEMTVSLGDVTCTTPENINDEVLSPRESCRRSMCVKCNVSAISAERGWVN